MTNLVKQRFSNHRQWREFIAAVHETSYSECPARGPASASGLSAQFAANWLSPRGDAELNWEPIKA